MGIPPMKLFSYNISINAIDELLLIKLLKGPFIRDAVGGGQRDSPNYVSAYKLGVFR